jgi:prephenate dehydrogenase
MQISQPPTLGIIGGLGQLGSWCASVFTPYCAGVLIADRGTALTTKSLVEQADIVVVSVPIGSTEEVLVEIQDSLRENQLVVDLTSVKTPFVRIMQASRAEVLSVHPMFAPTLSASSDQTCIVCRVRDGTLTHFFEGVLSEVGLKRVEMTPEAHDRMMAVVQGLTHFQAIAAAHCMATIGFNPQESWQVASPVYRLRLAMIGRILAQNPRLYAEIQIFNPYVRDVLQTLSDTHQTLARLVEAKDVEGFVREFERVRDALGSFSQQAVEETSRLL